jgi:hypothetical protein
LRKAISDSATVAGIEDIVDFLPDQPIYATAIDTAIFSAVHAKFGDRGLDVLNGDRTIYMRLYLAISRNMTVVSEAEAA